MFGNGEVFEETSTHEPMDQSSTLLPIESTATPTDTSMLPIDDRLNVVDLKRIMVCNLYTVH